MTARRECPYSEHAPLTVEGRMAWGAFCDTSFRVKAAGLGGIVGVETDMARRRLCAAGIDGDIADELLAAAERGFIAAWNEKDDTDGR